jgi:hypothetical protein
MVQKRTAKSAEYLLKTVEVVCEQNNASDIRCGGPATLGYDFFVDAGWSNTDITSFIEKELKDNDQEGKIYISEPEWMQTRPWSKRMIGNCIKEGY